MLNKLLIIGNLGKDPVKRTTPSGKDVVTFDVASNRKYKNAAGETVKETEWTRIEAWGALANVCAEYLTKGRLVYIEGRKKTDRVAGENGGEDRYFTKCIAQEIKFLGSSNGNGDEEDQTDDEPASDEIPF